MIKPPASTSTTLATLGLMIMMAGSAEAAVVTYTDQASWAAQTSITASNDFNEAGAGFAIRSKPYSAGGVTYTAQGLIATFQDSWGVSYQPDGFLDLEGNSFGMSFSGPITSLGFNFGGIYRGAAVALSITLSSGEMFSASAVADSYAFVGFTSMAGFDSITVTHSSPYVAVDNVSYGSAAVPEPGGLALVGLALSALAIVRRLRLPAKRISVT